MERIERNELILNYLSLANKLAYIKGKNTPKCVTIDELKSAAYMGLVDAAKKYRQEHGVSFGVYAKFRILGEMADYLRELRWAGRKPIVIQTLDERSSDIPIVNTTYGNLLELFEKITKFLTDIEKRVMKLYYIDKRSMREVAHLEGLSESRISQIICQSKTRIQDDFNWQELQEECS
jgi:RNA polymerase sigma factor (sigma-70 family)